MIKAGVVWLLFFVSLNTVADPQSHQQQSASSAVEEIYVLRSLRGQRLAPTEFCDESKVGFRASREDHYVFKVVLTSARDGKVIDAIGQPGGSLKGCFDGIPGDDNSNFYAEGLIAGVAAVGRGKCTVIASDYPEPGITSSRCFLVLSKLSAPYIGGVLTTNSIVSRQPIGAVSEPPGYIQPSIATIRLWRKRAG